MLFKLSIPQLKKHYVQLYNDSLNYKTFLKSVTAELSEDLNIDLNLLEKDLNDPVLLKTEVLNSPLFCLQNVLQSLAEAAAFKVIHPDWTILAGRLEIQRIKLQIPETLKEVMLLPRAFNTDFHTFCMEYSEELEQLIVPERDYKFSFFGIRTLEKTYLLRVENEDESTQFYETPQRMYLRVATAKWFPNIQKIKLYYDLLSNWVYTSATPTLANSGLRKGSLASCFLLSVQDDLQKIGNCMTQCMMISKHMGGVGFDTSNIRHSKIGLFGKSNGIVPMLKVLNNAMQYADQGGRRKGSATVFLQPWHVDFPDFLELKRQQGSEHMRAHDLFYSVWSCDLFMDRVESNQIWSLFCPKKAPGLTENYGEEFEKLYEEYENKKMFERQVPARDLWNELLKTQVETGMPFICHKDTANMTSNQKNLGIIRSSNLCVSGDTYILTDKGQIQISKLVGKFINVWNGEEWSNVEIFCTSEEPKKLLTVTVYQLNYPREVQVESILNCTPEHKFYIKNKNIVEKTAETLDIGDIIEWVDHKGVLIQQSVISVKDNNIYEPTYCFTEPKRHMGVFNGILTGQCTEIMEVSDEHRISSCNLASIALNSFVDVENKTYNFEELGKIVRLIVQDINQVIDRTYYPLGEDGPIKTTNMKYRPLGIGVQGLADTFMMLEYSWDSQEAKDLNKEIFACMYYNAVDESSELAKEMGSYDGFIGSPASKGMLKPDLIALERARKIYRKDKSNDIYNLAGNIKNKNLSKRYNWDSLRMKVVENGLRNSLLIALMPTASTAQILGNVEAFEPLSKNIYTKTVLSGDHIVTNRHMVKEFEKLGIWNRSTINNIIKNEGSVQYIPESILETDSISKLQKLKSIYKTVFEIKQKTIVDFAIDRSFYICQSQSLNIHIEGPTFPQLTSLHFYAWENCLSTGMYYLRSSSSVEAVKFTVEGEIDVEKKTVVCTDDVCVMCSS